MRRFIVSLAFAWAAASAAFGTSAPVIVSSTCPNPDGSTACTLGGAPANQVVICQSTGARFRCQGNPARWVAEDLPLCTSNPPTPGQACAGNGVCQSGSSGLWLCVSGGMQQVIGSGGGGSPTGGVGAVQVNNAGTFGAVSGFTADSSTGEVQAKIVNGVRYAKQYATGGGGTVSQPFTGWCSAIASGVKVVFGKRDDGTTAYYDFPDTGCYLTSTGAAGGTPLTDVTLEGDGAAVLTWGTANATPWGRGTIGPGLVIPAGAKRITLTGLRFDAGVDMTTLSFCEGSGYTRGAVACYPGATNCADLTHPAAECASFGLRSCAQAPTQAGCGTGGGSFIQVGTYTSAATVENLSIVRNTFGVMRYTAPADIYGDSADPYGSTIDIVGAVKTFRFVENVVDAAPQIITGYSGHATTFVDDGLEVSSNRFVFTQSFHDFGYVVGLSNTGSDSSAETVVNGLQIFGNRLSNINGGIEDNQPGSGINIIGNSMSSDILDFCAQLGLNAGSTNRKRNVVISDNVCIADTTFHAAPSRAGVSNPTIQVEYADNVTVSGNQLYGQPGFPLLDIVRATNVTVAGNSLDIDGTVAGTTDGIRFQGTTGANASGNSIRNADEYGIRVTDDGGANASIAIGSNAITDTTASGILTSGVSFKGTCTDCSASGNRVGSAAVPSGGYITAGTTVQQSGNTTTAGDAAFEASSIRSLGGIQGGVKVQLVSLNPTQTIDINGAYLVDLSNRDEGMTRTVHVAASTADGQSVTLRVNLLHTAGSADGVLTFPNGSPLEIGSDWVPAVGDTLQLVSRNGEWWQVSRSNPAVGGGSGDVVGPTTSPDTAVAVFNGVNNKTVKASPVLVNAAGDVTGAKSYDAAADDTHGGCLTLKEGADDSIAHGGARTASLCVPDSGGLNSTTRIDFTLDGLIPASGLQTTVLLEGDVGAGLTVSSGTLRTESNGPGFVHANISGSCTAGDGGKVWIGTGGGSSFMNYCNGAGTVAHTLVNLASNQTIAGVKTFSTGALAAADPVFTGNPTSATTPATGDADTSLANTAFVAQERDAWGVEAARAHAAKYADPRYYTLPAVVDIWQDIFLGRSTMQTTVTYNDNVVRQTLDCSSGCTGVSSTICMGPYSGSFSPIAEGDTFYLGKIGVDNNIPGNTPTGASTRTHVAYSNLGACGTGGTSFTVYPEIDYGTELHTDGDPISPVWREKFHPTDGAAYLIGWKLATDSRDLWGTQGRNLIRNPGFSSTSTGGIDGWAITDPTGALSSQSWVSGSGTTAPAVGSMCSGGEGSSSGVGNDCVLVDSTHNPSIASVIQTTPFHVTPGEQYIISMLQNGRYNCDYYGLADDRDGDGRWSLGSEMTIKIDDAFARTTTRQIPKWTSAVVTVPDGVHAVKFMFYACSTTPYNRLDFVSVRRQTALADSRRNADCSASTVPYACCTGAGAGTCPGAKNYLLGDPGTRNIVLMGDSWMGPYSAGSLPYADYMRQGIIDGYASRGITVTSGQVIAEGTGGALTSGIVSALPAKLAADKPLYIILDGGINDLQHSVYNSTSAVLTALENLKAMARLSMQAGAIPIFLAMPPISVINVCSGGSVAGQSCDNSGTCTGGGTCVSNANRYGSPSVYAMAHQLREALRNWQQSLGDGAPPSGGNDSGYSAYCSFLPAGSTPTLPDCPLVTIASAASPNIQTLNYCDAEARGRFVRIACGGYTGTIVHGNNIHISADFPCTADDVISLVCDGSNWLEVSRSVN